MTFLGVMEGKVPVGRAMVFDKENKLTVGTYDKADNKKVTDAPSKEERFASFDKTNTTVVKDFTLEKAKKIQQWQMAKAFMQEAKKEPTEIWGSTTAAKGLYLTKDNGGGPITNKFLKANG